MGLFILFQNFSNPNSPHLIKFIPEYKLKEYVGEVEAPVGFSEYAKSQDPNRVIIFDDRKFVKETLKRSPAYKALKEMVEVSLDPYESFQTSQEDSTVTADTKSDSENSKNRLMKLKANPGKGEATMKLNAIDNIETDLHFCAPENNVSLSFKQQLNSKSHMQLKMDSKDQAGSLQWGWNW